MENVSQIQSRGGLYDHFSSLNALYRIRTIYLGENQGITESHKNIMTETNDKYLACKLLTSCGVVLDNTLDSVIGEESQDYYLLSQIYKKNK